MANQKLTSLTENTTPLGSDQLYRVIDVLGTPTSRRMYAGYDNLIPEGFMVNGELSVTVATNNITVALKTKNGTNPSTTDPVSVWLNGEFRRCTAALSVTKAAGTNWFSSGSTVTAATEIDYFAYLVWNTTPATDIMDIGFARVPNARLYSDFSTTTTNDHYLAFGNASTPTSTDSVTVIGRFAATLSATASFNWSVPTYTNKNLIQYPIFNTRRLTFIPSPTGYSAVPTSAVYEYMIDNDHCSLWVREAGNGTSNATSITMTAPITAATLTNMAWDGFGFGLDNTAALTTTVRADITSGASSIAFYPNGSASSTWTGSGGKRIAAATLTYAI